MLGSLSRHLEIPWQMSMWNVHGGSPGLWWQEVYGALRTNKYAVAILQNITCQVPNIKIKHHQASNIPQLLEEYVRSNILFSIQKELIQRQLLDEKFISALLELLSDTSCSSMCTDFQIKLGIQFST